MDKVVRMKMNLRRDAETPVRLHQQKQAKNCGCRENIRHNMRRLPGQGGQEAENRRQDQPGPRGNRPQDNTRCLVHKKCNDQSLGEHNKEKRYLSQAAKDERTIGDRVPSAWPQPMSEVEQKCKHAYRIKKIDSAIGKNKRGAVVNGHAHERERHEKYLKSGSGHAAVPFGEALYSAISGQDK